MVALKRGIGLQFLLHASLGLVSKIIKRVCLFSSAGHPSVLNRVFFFFFFNYDISNEYINFNDHYCCPLIHIKFNTINR